MQFELFHVNMADDEARRIEAYDVNTVLMKEAFLAFSVCAIVGADDPDAAQVAEWFFPELHDFDKRILEDALRDMLAGNNQAGEIDMTEFVNANPLLSGSISPQAHALYKLVLGGIFAGNDAAAWSPGDVADIDAFIEFYAPMLAEYGFTPGGRGVSAAIGRLKALFTNAAASSAAVRAIA